MREGGSTTERGPAYMSDCEVVADCIIVLEGVVLEGEEGISRQLLR